MEELELRQLREKGEIACHFERTHAAVVHLGDDGRPMVQNPTRQRPPAAASP